MKTQKFISASLIAVLLGGSLLYSSCGRMRMSDDELEAVSDNSTAAGASQEVQNISEQAFTASGNMSFRGASNNGSLSSCATITNDTANNVLTIDFGTSHVYAKTIATVKDKSFLLIPESIVIQAPSFQLPSIISMLALIIQP